MATGRHGAGRNHGRREEGMALVAVVIMGLVLTILGMTLFGMATYEYNQATYRDRSASAFWLAEAAIERAKGEIFRSQHWSVGFDSIASGEGWYKLAIGDTTIYGDSARYIFAQGFVPRAAGGYVERAIEVFGAVGAAAFEYALFSMGDIEARGNPGVCGLVHANGEVDDGGSALDQLADTCRGGYDDYVSEGFVVIPPAMRTPAQYYPFHSYYYVVGEPGHAPGAGRALVYRALTPGAAVCADSLAIGAVLETIRDGTRVMLKDSLDALQDGVPVLYTVDRVSYGFLTTAAIDKTFHWTAGECTLDTRYGDESVVVNFGEYLQGTAPEWQSNLGFDDAPAYPAPILSTVINTRYTSADTSITALTNTANWTGGNNLFSHVRFTPANGIALLIHGIAMSGPSHIEIGTPDDPALFYLTGSILGNFNANGNIWGTTIVLGTIDRLTGNVDFHFHGGYKVELPPYLQPFWQSPSGYLRVLLWREVPPRYGA